MAQALNPLSCIGIDHRACAGISYGGLALVWYASLLRMVCIKGGAACYGATRWFDTCETVPIMGF